MASSGTNIKKGRECDGGGQEPPDDPDEIDASNNVNEFRGSDSSTSQDKKSPTQTEIPTQEKSSVQNQNVNSTTAKQMKTDEDQKEKANTESNKLPHGRASGQQADTTSKAEKSNSSVQTNVTNAKELSQTDMLYKSDSYGADKQPEMTKTCETTKIENQQTDTQKAFQSATESDLQKAGTTQPKVLEKMPTAAIENVKHQNQGADQQPKNNESNLQKPGVNQQSDKESTSVTTSKLSHDTGDSSKVMKGPNLAQSVVHKPGMNQQSGQEKVTVMTSENITHERQEADKQIKNAESSLQNTDVNQQSDSAKMSVSTTENITHESQDVGKQPIYPKSIVQKTNGNPKNERECTPATSSELSQDTEYSHKVVKEPNLAQSVVHKPGMNQQSGQEKVTVSTSENITHERQETDKQIKNAESSLQNTDVNQQSDSAKMSVSTTENITHESQDVGKQPIYPKSIVQKTNGNPKNERECTPATSSELSQDTNYSHKVINISNLAQSVVHKPEVNQQSDKEKITESTTEKTCFTHDIQGADEQAESFELGLQMTNVNPQGIETTEVCCVGLDSPREYEQNMNKYYQNNQQNIHDLPNDTYQPGKQTALYREGVNIPTDENEETWKGLTNSEDISQTSEHNEKYNWNISNGTDNQQAKQPQEAESKTKTELYVINSGVKQPDNVESKDTTDVQQERKLQGSTHDTKDEFNQSDKNESNNTTDDQQGKELQRSIHNTEDEFNQPENNESKDTTDDQQERELKGSTHDTKDEFNQPENNESKDITDDQQERELKGSTHDTKDEFNQPENNESKDITDDQQGKELQGSIHDTEDEFNQPENNESKDTTDDQKGKKLQGSIHNTEDDFNQPENNESKDTTDDQQERELKGSTHDTEDEFNQPENNESKDITDDQQERELKGSTHDTKDEFNQPENNESKDITDDQQGKELQGSIHDTEDEFNQPENNESKDTTDDLQIEEYQASRPDIESELLDDGGSEDKHAIMLLENQMGVILDDSTKQTLVKKLKCGIRKTVENFPILKDNKKEQEQLFHELDLVVSVQIEDFCKQKANANVTSIEGKTSHNNEKQASSKIPHSGKDNAVKEKARDEKNASFSDRNIIEYKVYDNTMAKFEFCNKFKIPNLEKDCGVSVQKKLPRTWIVTGTKENIEHFDKKVKSIMDSLKTIRKDVDETTAKALRPEYIESRHPCTLQICMKRRMPGNKLKGWRHPNGKFVCLASTDPTDTEYIKVTIQTSNASGSKCLNPSSEFCLSVPHWKDGENKEKSIVCENVHTLMSKAGDKVLSIPLNIESITGWSETKFMKTIIAEFKECDEQTSIVFVHPLPDVCKKLVQELNQAFLDSQEIKQEESSSGVDVMKKKLKISVVKGLLTEQKSDIIVNSTNNKLDFTSGFTAKSILKAAGVEIKRECYQRYPMGIPYDSIAETSGYKLCKIVLHCIMLDYEFPYSTRMKHLKSVVTKCLIKANFMKVKSIAFPAFGTGKLKYPCQDVAEVMFEATEKFASSLHPSDTSLEDVKFVIYGEDSKTIKAFEAVEKRLKTQKLSELGEQSSITTKVENLELVVTRSDSLLIPTDALVIIWKSTQLSGNQKISEKREYLWSLDKKAQIDIATIKNKLQTDRNSVAITSADGLKSQKHLLHVQLSFTSIEDIRKLLRSVFQKSDEEKYSAVTVIIDSKEFNSRAAGEFGQAIPEVIKEFLSKTPNYSLSLVQCFIKDKKSCESFLENLYTLDWTTWSPQESKGNAASLKSDDQSFKDQHMVLITGHKDNVGKCIDELFSGAIPKKMNSKEPPKQSISRDERFGNPATGDIRKPQEAIKMDSGREMDKTYTRLIRTEKEKCCVILKIKDEQLMARDEKDRKAYLWKHVQPAPELIVHPFNSSEKALLKYSTGHDAEKVVNQEMAEFELSEFPVQALNNLRATLSSKMMGIIEDVESLKQTIKENSGADVLSKDHQIYLEGNILEMEVAYKYLRQFVKEYKEKYENERSSPSTDMSKHAADSCRSLADGSQSGCSEHKCADQGSQLPFKDSVTCAVNTNPGTNSLSVPDEETSAISDGVRSSIKDPRVVKDRTNIVTENSCSSPTHSNTIATELKSNQSGNGKDTEMRNPSLRESKPEDQMTGRESKINPSTNVHRYNVSVPAEQYEVMKQLNLMSFLQRDIQKRDSKVVILMDDEQYNKYLNAEEKFHSLYNCTFDINPRVERGTIAPIKSNYAGQVFIGDEHFPKVKMYGINRNVVDQVISDFKSTSSYRASDYQQSRNRKQKRKN